MIELDYKKFRQAKAIEAKNKQKWLALNPRLDESSGIYILTRQDENGFRYAYVGQAKHILTRLSQHLSGYQHIDLSLKSHGLYSEDNPYGWNVASVHCPIDKLDVSSIMSNFVQIMAISFGIRRVDHRARAKLRLMITVRQKAIMTALSKAKRLLPRNYRISLKSTLKSV